MTRIPDDIHGGEMRAWIHDCAAYILSCEADRRLYERPSNESLEGHPDKRMSHHDFDGFVAELQAAAKGLEVAGKHLRQLRSHFSKGSLQPFDSVAALVEDAGKLSAQAAALVENAERATRDIHPPRSRELAAQKTAVRLAYAATHVKHPRKTREIARRILECAGLAEPDEKSLTNWLRELRKD